MIPCDCSAPPAPAEPTFINAAEAEAFAYLTRSVMVVCATCGNKRCPKAADLALECTGSNEIGQPGSAYPAPAEPSEERRLTWAKDAVQCGYNNWSAETPFGRILITWKGWKESPDACIDEFPGGDLPAIYGDPDDVRDQAEAAYWQRVDAAAKARAG